MTTTLVIREAVPTDAASLAALVNSAFRGETSKAGWTTEADLLGGQRTDVERIAAVIGTSGSVILIHEQNEVLLACVHLQRTGDDCYLGMMTVRPSRQASGLGRRLLETAEQWAIEHWASQSVHMTVIVQRPELVAWYERRGYRQTGEHKPFPYDDERFGLPRRPDLAFLVLRKDLASH